MALTTTSRTGAPIKKSFAWSYSRLKNFEVCPKRYYETDVAKNIPMDESEALTWGNAVHAALAARCGPDKTPLPKGMEYFEPWVVKLLGKRGDVFVEQDLAIDENFNSCGYFDRGVWFRAKGDFIRLVDDGGIVADWKTGKMAAEDSYQLALVAATVFAKYPQVKMLRASFIWLKEDAESYEDFVREDMPRMWRNIWPRIELLKNAHEQMNFPPVQNGTCKSWCKVTACPYNGKSNR
jgi:hypothetical protein